MTPSQEKASRYARAYAARGYNPLPMREDRKAPALREYAIYRDGRRVPEEWFGKWWSSGIQVCTGSRWGLAVVDLDGPLAESQWRVWVKRYGSPGPTWVVRTGGGGVHIYFSVPTDSPCRSRKIWGALNPEPKQPGDIWRKHCFVEIIGDRRLIVAPPSRHPNTKRFYEFVDGFGPRQIDVPALMPDWLAVMPAIEPPRKFSTKPPLRRRVRRFRHRLSFAEVLGDLSELQKLELARLWGLQLVGAPNPAGWIRCRAIGREDNNPSASFSPEFGYYTEPGADLRMSLFDCAVATGAHLSAVDALHEAASLFGTIP